MGDVVNLREYRKRRKRDQKREEAVGRRAAAGQTKQDRIRLAQEKDKAEQNHAAHRIDRAERDGDETA